MDDFPGKQTWIPASLRACLLAAMALIPLLPIDLRSATRYVDVNNAAPSAPFVTWATAAKSIQDAIDACSAGDVVVVTNGTYQEGGRVVYGALTNRVAVNKPVTVQSVNGPAVTIIQGAVFPPFFVSDSAVRCVYLTNGASLSGFTLRYGSTRAAGDVYLEQSGGGLWCESVTENVVSNCIVSDNLAKSFGGGAMYGTLNACQVLRNSLSGGGGGVYVSTLNDCTLAGNSSTRGLGGGAYYASLNRCVLTNNTAGYYGGAAYDSTLTNCVVIGNSAADSGGGIYFGSANNCTIVSNSATFYGGGVCIADIENSIVYYNDAQYGSSNHYESSPLYCCTSPLYTPDDRNFTNAPLFVNFPAGNLRLQSNSPCINAGYSSYIHDPVDLDGNPRIAGSAVDLGAYEYQTPGASVISYAWLQRYGLPNDGSADYIDSDGDGMNNWQERMTGTDPKDPASVLRLLPPTKVPSGLKVSWPGVTGVTYLLQRSTNLANPSSFQTLQTNWFGQTGSQSYFTDTNATGKGPYFYRIGVQ
jgi:parallel beta-helix repeat protein